MRIIADKYTDKDRVLLEQTVFDALHFLYRAATWDTFFTENEKNPFSIVEEECLNIFHYGHWKDVLLLKRVTDWLKNNEHPYWITGAGGSSAVLYVLGITEGNPLPPHRVNKERSYLLWAKDMIDGFDCASSFEDSTDNISDILENNDNIWERLAWARIQPTVCDGHGITWRMLWDTIGPEQELIVCCNPQNEYGLRKAFKDYKIIEDIEWTDMTEEERPEFSINIIFEDDVPETIPGFFSREITSKNWRDILRLSGLSIEEFMDRCFEFDDSSEKGTGYDGGNAKREIIGHFAEKTLFSDMVTYGGLCYKGAWNDTAKILVRDLGYPVHAMIAFWDDIYSWLLSLKVLDPNLCEAVIVAREYHDRPDYLLGAYVFLPNDGKKLSPFHESIMASPARGIEPWIVRQCRELPELSPKAQAVERILFELKLLASAQSGQENAR